MKFEIERLKSEAEEDYEEAWEETSDLIKDEGEFFSLEDKGSTHPLFDLVQEIRGVLSEIGFREVVVPTLIHEGDIRKQYGPQAPIILDRVFFLAGLDRSDLGIGRREIENIQEEIPEFDKVEELENIFRRYKKGEISSDDLVEMIMQEAELEESQASYIVSLFEDLKNLEPKPSEMTLRSHTTAGWFPVLEKVQHREPLPIQLFTVGPKYRREQELDETHLYRSWTASLVVMAEEISKEDGKRLSKKVLERLGFESPEFRIKEATSKYYAPDSEFEIFVEHPETGEPVEIGNAGFYNPISLANYEISRPIFNLGIGLERVLMIRTGEEDVRELVFPYEYEEAKFSDQQISEILDFKEMPETEAGRRIAEEIEKSARKYCDEPSPCEFDIFADEVRGKKVSVKLFEPEEGTELTGPAAFNEIYVRDGNIVGLPPEGWKDDDFLRDVQENGVSTGISYIEAFANFAGREIELAIEEGEEEIEVRFPMIESLGDINLELADSVRRYITSNNKKIDVRGPFFTAVSAEIRD